MTDVKLPKLLDAELKTKRVLIPKSQSAEINLDPLSTASLALMDGSGIRIRDFIELYTARGTAGIFRVKSPNNGYGTYTDTISLEHGICVLGDAIIPGEGTISGTPREVFSFLMGYQSAKARGVNMWTLGDVDVPDTEIITYDYRNSNTLHALLDVLEMVDGYMMQFDQTVYPWVLHIKAMETAPSCEGRLGRNINTAHVVIDDSELCTRVYCPRLSGGYMQLEENPTWGIVEQSLDFADEIPIETVEAECRKYLEARKEPSISVEIDGFELAAVTGEDLDAFDVGRMMRLALPAYGVTVEERITSISYASMIDQPEVVRIFLANKLEDASTSVSRLEAETSSFQNWRTVTEKVVTNLKESDEGIKEINNKMVAWFASVEIDLDASEEGANIGLLASYEETYDLFEDVDTRVTEAELILHGDGTSAQAGLIARVEENEELVSAAALTLYGDETTAQAGLVARVGDNESSLLLQADDIETLFIVKADTTYVQKLIADEIEAAVANFELSIAEEIVTGSVTANSGVIGALTLGGDAIRKTTISVVTGISGGMADTADVTFLNTEVGAATTVELGTATELSAKYAQGDAYDGALFEPGSMGTLQGEPVPVKLYTAFGAQDYLRGTSKRVTPIGAAVSDSYSTLYAYEGDGIYSAVYTGNMYYAGTAKTYYEGDGALGIGIESEFEANTLFYPGEEARLQGRAITDVQLYREGQYYSGGLFTDFEPGILTMQGLAALTTLLS